MMQADVDLLWLEQLEFIAIAAVVIFLAYSALEHKDIVYAAFFFGLMASVVAGFFLLLEAPFIAGMQIAVYTGGISALIVFGVLLLPRAQESSLEPKPTSKQRRLGLVMSFFVVILSSSLAIFFPWSDSFAPRYEYYFDNNLQLLSEWLWSNHGIYVQMTALILLTAIVGSIAILKMDKAESLIPIKGEFGIESVEEPIDDVASVEEQSTEEPTEEVSNE